MGAHWRTAEALAGRLRPDAGEPPTGRIEAGAELVEVNRLGDWRLVRDPHDALWWVDGRRLSPAEPAAAEPAAASLAPGVAPEPAIRPVSAPTPPPASRPVSAPASAPPPTSAGPPPTSAPPPPPPTSAGPPPPPASAPPPPPPGSAPPPPPAAPGVNPPARRPRQRRPALLAGLAVVVVVAVAASLLFVVLGGGPGAPGTVRGAVPLDFAVDAVGPAGGGDPWSGVMVAGGDQVVRIGAAEPRLAITTFEAGRPVDAVAVTPFSWGDTPAVLTTGAELLALDVSLDGIDTKLRLWTDIAYAPVLSRASSRDEVVFFPAGDGGRSGLFVVRNMVDPDGVEVRELPRPVVVNAAVELDGYLFIGHGEGLLVVAMQGDCEAAVAEFGGAVDALALSLRDDGAATLTALDTSARALSVFELPGTLEEVAGCGLEWIPRLAGSIDLDPAAGYAPSVATVLDTAYLITTDGDVVLVDIADPAQGRTDRVRGSIVGLVDPEGPVAPAAVAQPHEDLPSVFVVDPGASLVWWIAPGGEESRSMRITPP